LNAESCLTESKAITLTVGIDEPVHIVRVGSDNPSINVDLETIEDGKRYRINLFPISTDDAGMARIKIMTDYPKDKPRTFYVLARVK
jgi:hypothetical protein